MLTGAMLGALSASGLVLLATALLRSRSVRLVDRIDRSRGSDAHLTSLNPLAVLVALAPRIRRNPAPLLARLTMAGRPPDAARFTVDQALWGLAGAAIGLSASVVIGAGSLAVVLAITGAVSAVLLSDHLLTRAVRRRGQQMSAELPAIADLLAFAVSAGLPPAQAVERVAHAVQGQLALELRRAAAEVRSGLPFTSALREVSSRSSSPEVVRFIEGIVIAVERGTPMGDVLRAQAHDARDGGRRSFLELAGRREVAMLIPVVFFVLPIVVVIALYPGLHGLQISVP